MYIPEELSNKWTPKSKQRIESLFRESTKITPDTFKDDEYDSKDGELILSGLNLENLYHHPSNIKDINLYFSHFKNCNFKRTKFERVNFSQCLLEDCYLREAIFIDCVFIGTKFLSTNMQGANFTTSVMRHLRLHNCEISLNSFDSIRTNNNENDHQQTYSSLREIYAQIKANCYSYGDYDKANYFKEKELKASIDDHYHRRRYLHYFVSKFIALITGYGYKPSRVLLFSLVIIFLFSLIILFAGFEDQDGMIIKLSFSLDPTKWIPIGEVMNQWIKAFYLSTATFTTLGFFKIIPVANILNHIILPLEAFLGIFNISLFVVTLVNKYFRG